MLPALGLAGALYGPACSPARTSGSVADGDEDGAEGTYDSGVVLTGATRDDAGGLDASRTKRDASADAGKQDAVSAGGARDRDAGRAPPDASEGSDARVDSCVSSAVSPSAGCGKSARPNVGRIARPAHNYIFPEAYDGAEPFPLLIGFHAASNPIEQIENLTRGSDFEKSFVRALPKSKGSAWDYGADIGNVRAMYDDLTANHCVDRNRVFATGHSSGAQLIVQILTPANKADADHLNFRAVAPVAASRYGAVSGGAAGTFGLGRRQSASVQPLHRGGLRRGREDKTKWTTNFGQGSRTGGLGVITA